MAFRGNARLQHNSIGTIQWYNMIVPGREGRKACHLITQVRENNPYTSAALLLAVCNVCVYELAYKL